MLNFFQQFFGRFAELCNLLAELLLFLGALEQITGKHNHKIVRVLPARDAHDLAERPEHLLRGFCDEFAVLVILELVQEVHLKWGELVF